MPETTPPLFSTVLESTTAPSLGRDAVLDVAAILPGWLETVRHLHRQSGIQAAIWHDGELVAEVAVGPADAEAGIDLLPTHRLRIASHSKMMTTLAVLRLAEEGTLRLDDTLGAHVPELAGSPVAAATLRDLLSHAAGLSRDSADARWWRLGRPFPDREQLLAIARTEPLAAPAGTHLQYSNIGYGLVGLIIESVTGEDFAAAVTRLVIDPLGVEGIGPDLPADAPGPETPHGFAPGHTSLLHGPRRIVEQVPTGALAAATGFWATAGAIATVAGRALTTDALLGEDARRAMRRRVWTVAEGRHYALGLQQGRLHGFEAVGHSGGFPTGLSRTWAVPSERLAVSVIGTAVDAPTSEIAAGLLGLLALAAGRPAPQADAAEAPGAQGGGGSGRTRPLPLAEQEGVGSLTAGEVAELAAGTYDSLWGRTRVARLGGRLFALDDAAFDPAAGALELATAGGAEDPYEPGARTIALRTWGDPGYGTWAEPILVRLGQETGDRGVGGLRCRGLIRSGQLQTPSAEFTMPERVTRPVAEQGSPGEGRR
ncbi:beta-lactamase family protein [Brachybacterium sp. NBEC-018]|uniref:serine hydrolase domain-containing protein n=1 Tax=Brachybacterium sp. NBEC-018 TaxID=2996004 RepID=UPI002175396C|nr:serine hydrolase domain-containing protein [Brachybacterium sp. NBEC-018]UVY84391.1 beta-lactamase family protein [Brachybacterium sp. NBEC-018]